jgi:hypothetical protein
MKRTIKIAFALGAVAAVALIPLGATASGADSDTPINGPALEQATEAALDHLGDGVVTETEVGDEESFYEVEVTMPDGAQIDVQLDEQFNVVSTEADGTDEPDDS